jgi:hypothetical protein
VVEAEKVQLAREAGELKVLTQYVQRVEEQLLEERAHRQAAEQRLAELAVAGWRERRRRLRALRAAA